MNDCACAYVGKPGSAVLKPVKHDNLSWMQDLANQVYQLLEANQISSGQAKIILSMVKTRIKANQADLDHLYQKGGKSNVTCIPPRQG